MLIGNISSGDGAKLLVTDGGDLHDAVGLALDGFFEQVAGVTAVSGSTSIRIRLDISDPTKSLSDRSNSNGVNASVQ